MSDLNLPLSKVKSCSHVQCAPMGVLNHKLVAGRKEGIGLASAGLLKVGLPEMFTERVCAASAHACQGPS